jgi:hypothetical protein
MFISKSWFIEKIYFDFGGRKRTDDIKYSAPGKAPCPAMVTKPKFMPVQFNVVQKAKSYTIKIHLINSSEKVRNALANLSRMYPGLQEYFLEEAKRTLALNINQIADALRDNLSAHIENMRTVYDIFSALQETDINIKAKNREAADMIVKGASPDAIAAVNAEIAEMNQARNKLKTLYAAPILGQHVTGRRLVYHMNNRIRESLYQIKELKSFYCTACRAMGVLPPKEFEHNCNAEEAALIRDVFEKEVISAMKKYGVILRKNGTIEVSVIDLGGEEDDTGEEKPEAYL